MSSSEVPRLAWTAVDPEPAASWGPPDLSGRGGERIPDASPLDQAYSKGYHDGYAEGIARAGERLEPIRASLGTIVAEIDRELVLVRHNADANLIALALGVARWLFQREVERDPSLLEGLVRRAVALLPAGAPIEISLHPTDLERLSGHLDLKEPDGRPLAIHWSGDASLDRGSFRLIGPERLVDGRVDVALRSLYERLAV